MEIRFAPMDDCQFFLCLVSLSIADSIKVLPLSGSLMYSCLLATFQNILLDPTRFVDVIRPRAPDLMISLAYLKSGHVVLAFLAEVKGMRIWIIPFEC